MTEPRPFNEEERPFNEEENGRFSCRFINRGARGAIIFEMASTSTLPTGPRETTLTRLICLPSESRHETKPKALGLLALLMPAAPAAAGPAAAPAVAPAVANEEEQREIDELHEMLGRASARGSAVPVGLYVKFEVSLENRDKAEQARREREQRDLVRIEKARLLYEATQERRNKVRGKNASAMRELNARNLDQGQQIRTHKQAWEEIRQRDKEKLLADNRLKCEKGRANDARLDALEEAADEEERREATIARQSRIVAAKSFKSNLTAAKKERAAVVRVETQRAVSSRLAEVGTSKAMQAEECRLEALKGKNFKMREEQERLRKVAASRARSLESHAAAARAKEEMLLKKQIEAQDFDRVAEITIASAKNDVLRSNQMRRQQQFASRYVSQEAAQSFDGSTFRHYYMMDKEAEKAITASNNTLFSRVKTMKARTDDFIGDETAGMARAKAREASEARRKALALKLAKQNSEMQERLKNVKAVTDFDLTDDENGAVQAARQKAAAASAARREAEKAKLAKQNSDMRARLKATAARTDDDITDDVGADGTVGGGRDEAAAESKARKAAEAKQLAEENAARKAALKNVKAVTDDDVMDEAAGIARAEKAKESEERRKAEAKKLAEENAEYREMIASTTAKVDDDITDDPAGMARDEATGRELPGAQILEKPAEGGGVFGWGK